MGTNSNIVNSDNLGNIDLNSQGFRDDGSVRSSIQGAKNLKSAIKGIDQELATTMKDMDSYVRNSERELSDLLNVIDKLGKGYKTAFENSAIFKKATDDLKVLSNATKDYQRMVEDQNTSSKDLVNIYNKVTEAYTESSNAISYMTAATWDNNESAKDLQSTLRVLYQQLKDGNQLTKEQLQDLSKYIKDLEKSSGSLGQRVTAFADKTRSIITDIKTVTSLDKLVAGLGPSTELQIQTQLQQRYGMSNSQFGSFKSSLYGSFDKSMYSSQDVLSVMQSLNSMGLRTQQDVTKYFNKILEGQKILGMSAESQTALMQLSNKTGRDELTLGTNTFAKYIKEISNVSKEQLNQLVSINTTLASQMADLGVSSDAFRNTNDAVTGALTKASGGTELANLYSQVLTTYATSTDSAAEMLGMTSGQFKSYLESGTNPLDLIASSRGRAGDYYRALSGSNRQYVLAHQDEYTQGMDSSTVSLINQITRLQVEGKLTRSMIDKFQGMDGDAIEKELKDIYEGNKSDAEKTANWLENTYNEIVDWKVKDTLNNGFTLISNLLLYIASIISLKGSLFGNNGLFGGGTAGTSSKGLFASLGAKAGLTSAQSALAGGSILGGVAMMGYDAVKGYQEGGLGTAARYAFLGTGSKQNSDSDNIKAGLGNMGKYALIGAGIGTFAGGPVGTLVGGLIGAGVGAITAGIGMSMDKNTKEQEEANKKLDKIADNTARTATSLSIRETGRSMKSVIPFNSKISGSPAISGSGGPRGGPAIGNAGNLMYPISSGYGWRDDGFHKGIDFAGNIGNAPLFSNVDGTVVEKGVDIYGANFVGVQGSDGYIHYYWHMAAPAVVSEGQYVHQGDHLGYVGSTGYSTGNHLHYQVTRAKYGAPNGSNWNAFDGSTVDPWSFATNAIFSGSAAPYDPNYDYSSESSASSLSGTSLLSSISKPVSNVQLAAIGGSGNSDGIINSITDLKNTIVSLSKQATANEKLMKAITSTYNTQPRMS